MKLAGGTLIYTLMISLLISSLLSAYLVLQAYQQVEFREVLSRELAQDNLLSGLQLWLSREPDWEGEAQFPLFDQTADSCRVTAETWGLFGLLHGIGIHGEQRISRSVLVGSSIPPEHRYALWLADRRQPLVLTGQAKLEGRLLLPSAGIKSGYLGRIRYEGSQLFVGEKALSRSSPLAHDWNQLTDWQMELQTIAQIRPENSWFAFEDSLPHQDWREEPKRIASPGSIQLSNCSLSGKVLIQAAGEILVEATAQLDQVILMARTIRISAGFQGRIQAFATQNLDIAEGVVLEYPSVLMLCQGSEGAGTLRIGAASRIEGAVIQNLELLDSQPQAEDHVFLAEGSQVWGMLIADHQLELRGQVFGQVSSGNFILKTEGGFRRNYLYQGQIQWSPLSSRYAGPLLWEQPVYQLIQWL